MSNNLLLIIITNDTNLLSNLKCWSVDQLRARQLFIQFIFQLNKKSHTRIISENYAEALIAYTRATRIAISALSENARSGVARNFFGAVV